MKNKTLIKIAIFCTILIFLLLILLKIVKETSYTEPTIKLSAAGLELKAYTGSFCDDKKCVDKLEMTFDNYKQQLKVAPSETINILDLNDEIKMVIASKDSEDFKLEFNNDKKTLVSPSEPGTYIVKVVSSYYSSVITYSFKLVVIDKSYNEESQSIHTLDDGRLLFLTFQVKDTKNNTYISESISSNNFSIKEFLSNLEEKDTIKDGGTKIYHYNPSKKVYGKEKFYAIACNTLEGNKNIYVTKENDNIYDYCKFHLNDLDNVTMTIKEGTLTKTGLTLIITDTSNRGNIYGEEFYLEKESYHSWIKVPYNNDFFGFNYIGYEVGKDNKIELKLNWEFMYGELTPGKYRIVKSTSKKGEIIKHYITTEFEI